MALIEQDEVIFEGNLFFDKRVTELKGPKCNMRTFGAPELLLRLTVISRH